MPEITATQRTTFKPVFTGTDHSFAVTLGLIHKQGVASMHLDGGVAVSDYKAKADQSMADKLWREWRRLQRRYSPEKLRLLRGRWSHELKLRCHWWLKRHMPYQAVFIITTPRTGSNLLVSFLDRLPGTQSHSEVLNWGLPIGPKRNASGQHAMRHIRHCLQTLQAPIRCCKLFLNHLANYGLTLESLDLAFPNSKFIVLYRESLAEQYVSYELARSTDQWILLDGQEMKQFPLTVDPNALRAFSDELRRGYHEVLSYPGLAERGALFSYEELAEDPDRCLRDHICPLLGLPPAKSHSGLRKQNPQPLSGRVANYSEVAALMASPLCRQRYELPGRDSIRRKTA